MKLFMHEVADVEAAVLKFREDRYSINTRTSYPAAQELVERIGEIYDNARAREIRDSTV